MASPTHSREDLEQEVERLRRLQRIAQALNSQRSLASVLRQIVSSALELIGAKTAYLLRLEKGKPLVHLALAETGLELPPEEHRISFTVVEEVLATGKAKLIRDASAAVELRDSTSARRLHLLSILCVPLAGPGRLFGALYLENSTSRGRFQPGDQTFIEAMADHAVIALANAGEFDRLSASMENLRRQTRVPEGFEAIVGRNPALQQVLRVAAQVAPTELPVLITGETGTGKELIAEAIHQTSLRKEGPYTTIPPNLGFPRRFPGSLCPSSLPISDCAFRISENACRLIRNPDSEIRNWLGLLVAAGPRWVVVNCAALPPSLIESELFGFATGAFTGAERARRGKFLLADGGTLFLDEIRELSLELQGKLLRAIEQGEFQPLGSEKTERVEVRVITATNLRLEERMEAGKFREDLFYRLNGVRLSLPALRDRREDIPLLIEHFLRKGGEELGKADLALDSEAMEALHQHSYPGNVRELENAVRHGIALCQEDRIRVRHLPASTQPHPSGEDVALAMPRTHAQLKEAKKQAAAQVERNFLLEALRRSGGNVTEAARQTGMHRTHFHDLLRRHGLAAETRA